MMVLKTLLAGSFLMTVALVFFHSAKKISCHHLFQLKAFSTLTHKLHSKNVFREPRFVCGEILLTNKVDDFVEIRNTSQRQKLKLKITGNVVNEKI